MSEFCSLHCHIDLKPFGCSSITLAATFSLPLFICQSHHEDEATVQKTNRGQEADAETFQAHIGFQGFNLQVDPCSQSLDSLLITFEHSFPSVLLPHKFRNEEDLEDCLCAKRLLHANSETPKLARLAFLLSTIPDSKAAIQIHQWLRKSPANSYATFGPSHMELCLSPGQFLAILRPFG